MGSITTLYDYIIKCDYNNKIQENLIEFIGEEIINESFKSTLLQNLAREIKRVEEPVRKADKINAAKYSNYHYKNRAKSFSSIFGPYRSDKNLQGLKWDEIKDSDFVFIKAGSDEKVIKKAIKPIFKRDAKGDIIICEPGTKIPVLFVKGYGMTENTEGYNYSNSDNKAQCFYFSDNLATHKQGVRELVAPKGKYNIRPIKLAELLPNLDEYDIYVLMVTDDMVKTYDDLTFNRKESQKGIINFDENSLKIILAKQQARYKILVKELKTKKLEQNSDKLFDEIVELNDKVVELYRRILNNAENMYMYTDIGGLMQYVTSAYDDFYQMKKHKLEYAKQRDIVKQLHGDNFNQQDFDDGNYSLASSKSILRDIDNYIKNIKNKIKEIESKIK